MQEEVDTYEEMERLKLEESLVGADEGVDDEMKGNKGLEGSLDNVEGPNTTVSNPTQEDV